MMDNVPTTLAAPTVQLTNQQKRIPNSATKVEEGIEGVLQDIEQGNVIIPNDPSPSSFQRGLKNKLPSILWALGFIAFLAPAAVPSLNHYRDSISSYIFMAFNGIIGIYYFGLYYGKQHKEKQQLTKRKSNLNVWRRSQLVPSDKNTTEQCPDPETTPTRAQTQNKTKPRFDFLDNIKTVLTVVVLLFHLSGGFGASAGVVLKIGDFSNNWSKYWSSFFIGPCSFFFMSLFFFISAYFVPRSLAKKGRVIFIKERAQRILFGAVIATFIFTPVAIIWAIVVAAPSWGTTFSDVHWQYQPIAGTTWFLWWLFFFNIWYSFTASTDNNYRLPLSKYFKSFPSSFVYRCLVGIFICGYLQYCATVYLFADASNFAFMPVDAGNDFICYLLFFYIGLLAGENRWFEHEKSIREQLGMNVWLHRAIVLTLYVFVSVLTDGLGLILGLPMSPAASYVVGFVRYGARGMYVIEFSIAMLEFFQTNFNYTTAMLKWCLRWSFGAYLLQNIMIFTMPIAIFVYMYNGSNPATPILFDDTITSSTPIPMSPLVIGWMYSALIFIPLCYVIASILGKLPVLKYIL